MEIEVLAPVGGEEQLIAAVKAGADAVYLGTENFNARRNAHNFTDLSKTVEFCHNHGVKVFVTLNTVIKNKEIGQFVKTVREIADSGADAVIVQDLGGISLIKEVAPDLPLHASTQMTVHNLSGVKALEKLGFTRAVLARELSEKEIKYICDNTDMEIEVFVHGALCVCVSGQCYLSSMLGGRSGNRGLCAQPCRLDFKNKERNYALSLKDMSLYDNMKSLINCGVKSLKIEGRMKRPEYVYTAVKECRKAVDGYRADMYTLEQVFSRSGFTDGYFKGNLGPFMFGRRTEENVNSMMKVLSKIEKELISADFPKRESIKTTKYETFQFEPISVQSVNEKKIRIRAEKLNQISFSMINEADKIILPANEILKENIDKKLKEKLIAELPLLVFGEEKRITDILDKLKEKGIREVIVGNIGTMYEAVNSGFTVHTDYSMNLTNKYSTKAVSDLGVKTAVMSFETNSKDIKGALPVGIIAYGYLPLMTYRSCPVKTKAGCKNWSRITKVKDRNGKEFSVICRGSYSQLLNSVPLYIADKLDEIKCDFITLYFTVEGPNECEKIFLDYKNKRKSQKDMTRGLYFKELV